MLLYDLLRAVINKEFLLDNMIPIIENLHKEHSDFLKKNLVEVLWILGFGLERKREINQQNSQNGIHTNIEKSNKMDQEHIHIYSNIVNSFIRHKIVDATTLIESLNEANLVDCGLIPDQDFFIKKISRLNTKMIYEQQKYNLLREESEGFSKLIFLLFEVKFTESNVHKYIDKIFSLIGFFDLDPNRVLDITLSAFETDCNNLCFLEILKLLNLNALPHVLGFKISNMYQNIISQNQKQPILENKEIANNQTEKLSSTTVSLIPHDSTNPSPSIFQINKHYLNENSLLEVTAQLIKNKILDITKIIPHLSPNLKETEENYTKNVNEGQKAYFSIHTKIAKDLTFLSGNYIMFTQSNTSSTNNSQAENLNTSTIPNYFVNFNEYINEILTSCNNNQFYKLLKNLVKVRAWDSCDLIHGLLENNYDPIGSSELVFEVCEALKEMIKPLYKKAGLEIKLKFTKKENLNLNTNNLMFNINTTSGISNDKLFNKTQNNFNKLNLNEESHEYMAMKNTFNIDNLKMSIDKGFENSANSKQQDIFENAEDYIIRLPKILKFITLGLGFDQILFQKILKLIKHYSHIYIPVGKQNSFNSTNHQNTTINNSNNNEYSNIITDLICKVFLPAISIIEPTPTLLTAFWDVLNLFDYSKRYKIYNYWINYMYNTHPVLYVRSKVILRETSKWQNTFSKENQKSHGRILGVLTRSNPVIIFDKIIKPLTSYDNQIDIIIKALGYGSSLQYDVISYVIGKTLTDSSKEKLDMNFGDVHNWFKNFCYFVGSFYKEYQNVDFSFIFHYLGNQLKNKNQNCYIEFLIVKEMIEKMSMVFTQESMDESQVQSCYGGLYLYLEAMDIVKEYKTLNKPIQNLLKFFMSDIIGSSNEKDKIVSKINTVINGIGKNGFSDNKERSNEITIFKNKSVSKSPNKNINEKVNGFSDFKENNSHPGFVDEEMEDSELNINNVKYTPMQVDESMHIKSKALEIPTQSNRISFTFILLVLLGVRRTSIIFNSNYTQTKLLGFLYDKIQFFFVQLMQFLTNNLEREQFKKILPNFPLEKYVISYKCQPEVVYYLVRNSIKPIYELDQQEYNMWISQFNTVVDEYNKLNLNYFEENFDPIYLNKKKFMEDSYKNIWNYITPELFFIFSALQLKDIYLPKHRYEFEIDKNLKKIQKLQEENQNKTISESQIRKNKKEITKIENSIANLKKELEVFTKHQDKILKFLEKKNLVLLKEIPTENKREISKVLIQNCLFPRLIFSSTEALYASKMLILLINIKMHNINFFDLMQKFIKFLLPCVVTVTEFEALNIGYFLLEFLKVVKYWQDEKIWNEECYSNPCFSRNLNTPSSVEHQEFKKVMVCLLNKMKESFINILKYDDYMSCRNVIIVLNSLISVYPTSKEIGNGFITAINEALEKFTSYENLMMMMKRYRDIIITKLPNLPSESNEPEKKIEGATPGSKSASNVTQANIRQRDRSKNRDRGRSREAGKDRTKRN